MKFTWKKSVSQFGSTGEFLYINKIRVGNYSGSAAPHEKEDTYVGASLLPGQTSHYVYGATPEEVKAKIEGLVIAWFAEINRVGTEVMSSKENGRYVNEVRMTAWLACKEINSEQPLRVAQAIKPMRDAIICVLAQISAGKDPIESDCLRAALAQAERKAE